MPDTLVRLRLAEGYTDDPSATSIPLTVLPTNVAAEPTIATPPGKININTCSAAELVDLAGVGVSTANEVLNGRPYTDLATLASDHRLLPHIGKFVL